MYLWFISIDTRTYLLSVFECDSLVIDNKFPGVFVRNQLTILIETFFRLFHWYAMPISFSLDYCTADNLVVITQTCSILNISKIFKCFKDILRSLHLHINFNTGLYIFMEMHIGVMTEVTFTYSLIYRSWMP